MYLSNKYTKTYYSLIEKAQQRSEVEGYTERHHIIPRSLGGDDSLSNLVTLTSKEHFVCHLLLTKMTVGEDKAKMVYAFWCMCNNPGRVTTKHRPSSRSYNLGKKMMSEQMADQTPWNKGISTGPLSDDARKHLSNYWKGKRRGSANPFYGKTHSDNTKKYLSEIRKGRPSNRKGIKMSDEQKEKIRESMLKTMQENPRSKITCPHCGKQAAPNTYSRWHGDNCKKKS